MQKCYKSILIDNIPCGFCVVKNDTGLTITCANTAFYHIYGYTSEEVRAAGFNSIGFVTYPADLQKVRETLRGGMDNKARCFSVNSRVIHRSGKILWVLIRCCTDESGGQSDCAVLDITDQIDALEAFRLNDKGNALLLEHAGRFTFRFYISARTALLAPNAARVLGMPERVEHLPESIADSHPAPESREDFLHLYDAMLRGDPSGNAQLLFRNHTGNYAWYDCTFSMIYDQEGTPQHAVVSFEDISEYREREIAYEKLHQFFKSQKKGCIGYYEYNLTKNKYSKSEEPPCDTTPSIVVPEFYTEFITYIGENYVYFEDIKQYYDAYDREKLLSRYTEGQREMQVEYRRRDQKGDPYWALGLIQLFPDPYTNDVKAFILVKNIDEKKKKELALLEESQRDPLTGVMNRKTLVGQVNTLLHNSDPAAHHIFIMFDIDNFKEINDHMGHQFGDRVLIDATLVLRKMLRTDDLIGRLGGDEFVACMKNMSPDRDALTQKIQSLCDALHSSFRGELTVSSSMGVAMYPQDGASFDTLYKKADIALYEAKRHGRNQFRVYDSAMAAPNG